MFICLFYTKGAARVIHYHGDSVVQALVTLFPDIGLEKTKFTRECNYYYFKKLL